MIKGLEKVMEFFYMPIWVLRLWKELVESQWSGTLMIDFYKGNPSKRYREQITKYGKET